MINKIINQSLSVLYLFLVGIIVRIIHQHATFLCVVGGKVKLFSTLSRH